MAERLAVAYCARLGLSNFTASSAGTRAVIGHPIHPEAARVLKQLGGEASSFSARQVTARIAADADLVLTMTKAHRDAVLELAPRQLNRTFTLREAKLLISDCGARDVADLAARRSQLPMHEVLDIADPIGQDENFHAMVGSQIADLLPPILDHCRSSASATD